METIEYLRELFAYNDWANRRLVAALKTAPSEKSLSILAHLLVNEAAYYDRLHGKDLFGFDPWKDLSAAECGDLARETAANYEKLLRRFDDEGLDYKINYRTSEGSRYENSFRELLTHVLFHSSIHRGNIVLKMREEGYVPPALDYIIFLRETKR